MKTRARCNSRTFQVWWHSRESVSFPILQLWIKARKSVLLAQLVLCLNCLRSFQVQKLQSILCPRAFIVIFIFGVTSVFMRARVALSLVSQQIDGVLYPFKA